MTAPSGRRPLGRLLLATIAFAFVGLPGVGSPVGLAALPLMMLVLVAARRPRSLLAAGIASGMVGALWLASGSGLPAQTASATALIGGVAFAAVSASTRSSFAHRALLATAATAVLVSALFAAQGITWHELRWFVARDVELPLRMVVNTAFSGDRALLQASEPRVRLMIAVMATGFPTTLALALVAGCGLAALIAERIVPGATGPAPGRFREFRFSEHLGWLAVVPAFVLIVKYAHGAESALTIVEQAGGVYAAAANALFVVGALYALRGLAVITYALAMQRSVAMSIGTWTGLVILAMLSLLAAFLGAILLGLLDSVLDIRRRWLTPPPIGA